MLCFRNLTVAYGNANVVKGVSFSVARGEVAALVGESGSGKTQTVLAALKLLPPQAAASGSIEFDGVDLLSLSQKRLNSIRGRRIAMIFQEPMSALDPLFTVGDQIGAVLRLHAGLSRRAAARRTLELLDLVEIPEPGRRCHSYPHELSGGQRQRVAIAMAISCDPDVLIADEPTTALDVTVAARIFDLLAALRKSLGMALIFISHDLGLVRGVADAVHVLRHGELVESGSAAQVFQNPRCDYTRLLLTALPKPREPRPAPGGPEVLRAEGVTVRFRLRGGWFARAREIKAVDGASLVVREGRTLGLVGESGSGKSTLARALLRLAPLSGAVIFEGEDISRLGREALRGLRRSMQLVFQDPYGSLSPRMTAGDIVTEGLRVHEPSMSRAERDVRAARALEEVLIDPALRRRFPHEFSGGQRQRIAIARAMILKPRLVVLDEPTSALDRTVQIDILALLERLQERHRLAYVFISHDLAVVRAVADDIGVMKEGRIIEIGNALQIFENPREAYTRTLLAASFHASDI
ncbi:dipeptide ABC transporter ATP-binding protein [Methylocapsa palsarum]|uniref:ABC transporter ATP-binding protein n=1 Tax=Methylocapsa palsarum TaxID=1612308 RepID=UPI000B8360C7